VAGRGTVDYVAPQEDVESAVASLLTKITHPVLVDLAIEGAPVRLRAVQPASLPDLYAGEELVLFGRYAARGAGRGEVVVTGAREGRRQRFATVVEFPERNPANAYLPGLWAARRVGELMRTIRLEGATPERIEEVRELALRYGLLTEYTSYLVQEPGVLAQTRDLTVVPAPAAPVNGQAAVGSARAAAALREARTVVEAQAAERAVADQLATAAPGTRVVAGRRFSERNDVWVDAAHSDRSRVVEVEPYSEAWFGLLERLPELRPFASEFDAVLVAGERVSIRIRAGGAARLKPGELDAIVNDFRAGARRRG
jgi:Ca-activated chloride channel homolog